MSIGEVFEKVKEAFGIEGEITRESDVHKRLGDNPHATFEQSHPAVNKDEPAAFANPIEAGAKKLSEEQCGRPMPRPFTDDLQPSSDYRCPADAHARMGDNPHATFEQGHPAVNLEEPRGFANPCESGAKKPSEAQMGKPMPQAQTFCQ
ncbi:MAG: hypothetical protein HY913_09880 [Desulfomonile tiedjei]|nr:hypothetical protein [Desulfomonile tiedjei]